MEQIKDLLYVREEGNLINIIGYTVVEIDAAEREKISKNYRKVQTASDGKLYEVLADSKIIM